MPGVAMGFEGIWRYHSAAPWDEVVTRSTLQALLAQMVGQWKDEDR